MKIYDIDTYLALPGEVEVTVKDLQAFFIREIARYYGAEIIDTDYNVSTVIKKNGVTLILMSKPKKYDYTCRI